MNLQKNIESLFTKLEYDAQDGEVFSKRVL